MSFTAPFTRKQDTQAKLQDMIKTAEAIFYGTNLLRRRDDVLSPSQLAYMERTHSDAANLLRRLRSSQESLNKG